MLVASSYAGKTLMPCNVEIFSGKTSFPAPHVVQNFNANSSYALENAVAEPSRVCSEPCT